MACFNITLKHPHGQIENKAKNTHNTTRLIAVCFMETARRREAFTMSNTFINDRVEAFAGGICSVWLIESNIQ